MQTKVSDGEGGYGLALWTSDNRIPGEVLKGHTGSAYGLYSMMFFEPHKKFGIVAITNGCIPARQDNYILPLKSILNLLYESIIK